MPTVKIPPVLRAQTGGEAELETPGSTVGEVLRSLAEAHPGTTAQLFADGGWTDSTPPLRTRTPS
jgi:sulfur-carrier protein